MTQQCVKKLAVSNFHMTQRCVNKSNVRRVFDAALRQMESETSSVTPLRCHGTQRLCPVVLDHQEPPGGRAGDDYLALWWVPGRTYRIHFKIVSADALLFSQEDDKTVFWK